MFDVCLIDDRYKLEAAYIRFINCKKETGLYLVTSTFEEIISKFVLNSIFYHVGMSWIICSDKDEINYPNWLNKIHWHNTAICSRLHGILFGDFITHARTNRYNILYSLVAHDKKQHAYEDDGSSILDRIMPKHMTE